MKFNTYDRTPRRKTPRWITIILISFFAGFTAIMLLVGVALSIDLQSVFPFFIMLLSILFFAFIESIYIYNVYKAYFEIDADTIKLVSYPFFKRKEKSVSLADIKKIKRESGGKPPHYLAFKNNQNKTLFRTVDVPEIRAYFETLGFKVEF